MLDRGSSALTNQELLAVVLRTGYQGKTAVDVADRLLKKRSLSTLLALPPQQLRALKGVGTSRALSLLAGVELAKRATQTSTTLLNSPDQVAQAASDIAQKKQEHLLCFYLDGRHHLLDRQTICVGTLTTNLIHPREVFAPALELRAASIVLAHNHPSGTSQPSLEDVEASLRIQEAGEILAIPLLDHVVVSSQGWTSLKSEQLI